MPSLLIVDKDRNVTRTFQRCFADTDVTVCRAGTWQEAAQGAAEGKPDVVVLDVELPDGSGLSALEEIRQENPALPVVIMTAPGASEVAIESTRLGAMDFLTKPLDVAQVREVIGRAISISSRIRVNGNCNGNGDNHHAAEVDAAAIASRSALLGASPAMQEVYKAIGRVAARNINVLIRGESGTGKELVAHAIHQHSDRAKKQFMAVNCAAIPEAILESELFGHEKGAFTGAVGLRIGKFEECDGGTLFLDEVGDMPLLMQSKVLRAIQEKEFQRVGGNETIASDVRIIAATNRDLDGMVANEQFRADLSFRLNGYQIALPALRDRRDDIPILVEHYLRLFNMEIGKSITTVASDAMERLQQYSWPGNIRELQTALKQAMLHTIGSELLVDFLPAELRQGGAETPPSSAPGEAADMPAVGEATIHLPGDAAFVEFAEVHLRGGTHSLYADSVRYMESILLTHVLRHSNGNQSQAAAILGITRGCLRGKLRQHGISISSSVAIRETPNRRGEPLAVTGGESQRP
jgi:two-component system nitrogen regulation response regulator GlnG